MTSEMGRRSEDPSQSQADQAAVIPDDATIKRDLFAVLNAFDLSTPGEQARILADIGAGIDPVLPPEAATRGMQAANLSGLLGEDRAGGLHRLDSLEDAAQQIPGIKTVLSLLSSPIPRPQEEPQKPK